MTMEIEEYSYPAERVLIGANTFEMSDGKLKIQVGEDKIFEESVPSNKLWTVSIHLKIIEVDV